jgi:hypothetical protein
VPKRVRHQVVQHALDLLGRRQHARACSVDLRSETYVPGDRLRLEGSQARVHQRPEGQVAQLERQHPGVDSGELEEVVHEQVERPHLLAHGRQVAVGLRDPVLERLEHGLHGSKGRSQVMARPGDELPAGVEEALDVAGHLVERSRQVGQLRRPALRRPRREVAARERRGRGPHALDRPQDRAAQEERGGERGGGGGRRDRQDRQVVLGVEHGHAGEEDRAQRKQDGREPEAGELEPQRRKPPQEERRDQSGAQGCRGDDEREGDHGTNR